MAFVARNSEKGGEELSSGEFPSPTRVTINCYLHAINCPRAGARNDDNVKARRALSSGSVGHCIARQSWKLTFKIIATCIPAASDTLFPRVSHGESKILSWNINSSFRSTRNAVGISTVDYPSRTNVFNPYERTDCNSSMDWERNYRKIIDIPFSHFNQQQLGTIEKYFQYWNW